MSNDGIMVPIEELFGLSTNGRRCGAGKMYVSVKSYSSQGYRQIDFGISNAVMKELRWVPSDRVAIGVTETKVHLYRTVDPNKTAWKLSPSSKAKDPSVCNIRITANEALLDFLKLLNRKNNGYYLSKYSLDDGVLSFDVRYNGDED